MNFLSRSASKSSNRFFSTAAKHQPPKKIPGTIGRYAGAVYTASSKAGNLEKVETELSAIKQTLSKSVGFGQFLSNPTIARSEKVGKIDALLDDKKFSHITKNLMITLAANGRSEDAGKVIGAFEEMMQAGRGATKVTIISADALDKKQLATVQKSVLSMIGGKGAVEVETKVDTNIMGGLQILVGDQFLDLSVASRVTELSSTMDAAS